MEKNFLGLCRSSEYIEVLKAELNGISANNFMLQRKVTCLFIGDLGQERLKKGWQ
jgi:hypothetical protein